ncbi:MAG: hypothetical protein GWN73_30365, partial [Actinobacteria bacterium]|nr:hypothetical protein [Actinomycetota bacterium]NIS34705.1 hypothetical protein [Actinomycetota bacterium]NIU69463.1 hypothetical protein [Actinomycetota bacterium]NIW31329.1 hypothetical protein [Actinomycetota bacterium]
RSLTTGTVHYCGLTRDGVVYCWGQNGIGQLGNETFISSATPVLVQTDERFVAL